jgi:hypothetical protein
MGGIIKQNYTWAMGFNAVGLTLATMGVLNPIVAALFHHLSSVFVVVNATFEGGRSVYAPRQFGPFFGDPGEYDLLFHRHSNYRSSASTDIAPAACCRYAPHVLFRRASKA